MTGPSSALDSTPELAHLIVAVASVALVDDCPCMDYQDEFIAVRAVLFHHLLG
jgi:hypothetical protein